MDQDTLPPSRVCKRIEDDIKNTCRTFGNNLYFKNLVLVLNEFLPVFGIKIV